MNLNDIKYSYSKDNALKNMADKLHQEASEIEREHRMQKYMDHRESYVNLPKEMVLRFNEYENKIKVKTLKESIAQLYYNALPIDSDVKIKYKNKLKKVMIGSLEENYSDKEILDKIKNTSEYLSELVDNCISEAKKEIEDKREETKSVSSFKELEDLLDHEEFIPSSTLLDTTQDVSDIIKDKVIQVIRNEEEIAQKEKDLIDDITTSKNSNETTLLIQKNIVKEHTLFKSIMVGVTKELLKNASKNKNLSEGYFTTDKETSTSRIKYDSVLFESILEYTLLETFNTLRLKTFDLFELKTLAKKYST